MAREQSKSCVDELVGRYVSFRYYQNDKYYWDCAGRLVTHDNGFLKIDNIIYEVGTDLPNIEDQNYAPFEFFNLRNIITIKPLELSPKFLESYLKILPKAKERYKKNREKFERRQDSIFKQLRELEE